MISPLNDKKLRDWFSAAFQYVPCKDSTIYTMGSEPFLEDDFDAFLRAGGLEITQLCMNTDVLIIGHSDFDEEVIKELLDLREGQNLRVYSQEMFLAHWMTGQDPFDDEKIIEAFAEDHAGFQFLKSCWVDWVSTEVSLGYTGRGANLKLDAPETSVLKEMGYTVGKTKGIPAPERHRILEIVFSSKLKNILSPQYVKYCKNYFPQYLDGWGEPKSPERLAKMRDFISALCKQQKRRGNAEAASDYEEDLKWLDMCCRTGRFKFKLTKAYIG